MRLPSSLQILKPLQRMCWLWLSGVFKYPLGSAQTSYFNNVAEIDVVDVVDGYQ